MFSLEKYNLTTKDFRGFCNYGLLDYAKWCYDNIFIILNDDDYFYLFYNACENNHIEIAKWLLEICPDLLERDLIYYSDDLIYTITNLFDNNNIEFAFFLINLIEKNAQIIRKIFKYLAKKDSFNILKKFYMMYEKCLPKEIEYDDDLEYLYTHHVKHYTTEKDIWLLKIKRFELIWFKFACEQEDGDIIHLLTKDNFNPQFIAIAFTYGNKEIIDFLLTSNHVYEEHIHSSVLIALKEKKYDNYLYFLNNIKLVEIFRLLIIDNINLIEAKKIYEIDKKVIYSIELDEIRTLINTMNFEISEWLLTNNDKIDYEDIINITKDKFHYKFTVQLLKIIKEKKIKINSYSVAISGYQPDRILYCLNNGIQFDTCISNQCIFEKACNEANMKLIEKILEFDPNIKIDSEKIFENAILKKKYNLIRWLEKINN